MLFSSRPRCAHAKRQPRRRIQPTLEVLENRCVPARTWTGNALLADGITRDPRWSQGANWLEGVPPPAEADLTFPSSSSNFTSDNDLTPGTKFGRLQIAGNYTITGRAIELLVGSQTLLVTTLTGTITVGLPIQLTGGAGSGMEVQNAATTLHLQGVISGSSGLTKSGPGVLTLSAANTYTGATNIQAGILQKVVNVGVLPDSSTVTVASGATLNLAGFTELVGALAGAGSVTLGNATLAVGANEQDTVFSGAISGNIGRQVTGAVTKVGARLWSLLGTIAATDLRVANGTMTLSGHNLDDNIAVLMDPNTLLVVGGEERIGSLAGAGEVVLPNGPRLFAGGNNSDTEFSGIIHAGTTNLGGFSKEGAGIMTLTGGPHHFPDGLGIDNGTLKLGGPDIINDDNLVNVSSSGIFDFANHNEAIGVLSGAGEVRLGAASLNLGGNNRDISYAGIISGVGGAVAKNGAGIMTLSGANTFTRGMHINGGTLRLGADNVLHDSVPVGLLPNTTFDLQNHSEVIGSLSGNGGEVKLGAGSLITGGDDTNRTYDGVISGVGGAISKRGSGVMTLSGQNTFTGGAFIDAGTLRLGANNVISDGTPVSVGPAGAFDLNGFSETTGALTISNGRVITGAGTLSVAGTLTMTGGTIDTGTSGTLQLGGNVVATSAGQPAVIGGSGSGAHGDLSLGGATRTFTVTTAPAPSNLRITARIVDGAPASGLIKTGNGRLNLAAANIYSGTTVINQGEIVLENSSALGSADGTAAAGTTVGNGATLTPMPGLAIGNEALALNGNGATLRAVSSPPGTWSWAGPITVTGNNFLEVTGFNTMVFSGALSGSGALFQDGFNGNGTVILNGVSPSFTGLLRVDKGTLLVNGTLAGSQLQVDLGGRLGGTGTVGAVSVFNGTLNPGASPGSLRTGNVELRANSTLRAELNGAVAGTGYDQLQVAGTVNLGGSTLNASLGFTPAVGAKFTIIANNGGNAVVGTFKNLPEGASITLGATKFRITYVGGDGNDVVLLTPTTQYIVTGPDAGGQPRVRVFDAATQQEKFNFLAYPAKFKGGVRVATADVNGDGFPDIITAPGPGTAAVVQVFSGATQPGQIPQLLAMGKPYGNFKGGAFVAVGDVNGDRIPDIITGPGSGTAPAIRTLSAVSGALISSFNAFPGSFKGGVTVAAGDVNGDGKLDIIAGMASGNKPLVRVFDAGSGTQLPGAIGSFLAYPASFKGGVYVAAGDVGGDAAAEIITGAGPGATPLVRIFTPTTVATPQSILAYPPGQKRGVRVSTADINGDGKAEILTALGPKGSADVRIFNNVSTAAIDSFFAELPSVRRGLFVAGSPTR